MRTLLDALTGWLLYGSLIGVVGALAGRWVLAAPLAEGRPGVRDHVLGAASRLGERASWILVPALALYFLRQLLNLHDPLFATWSEDVRVLLGAFWGRAWLGALAGAAVVAVGFRAAARGRAWGWSAASLGALVACALPAFTGHANAEGPLRPITLGADVLHVVAAGGWIGGLGVVLYADRRARRDAPESRGPLPELVGIFSPVALGCAATLALTGLLAALIHLPDVGALFSTGYGRLLSTKLLVVLGVVGMGAVNWRRLTPRLHEPGGRDALRRAAAVELLLGQLVILVTALLVRASPSG